MFRKRTNEPWFFRSGFNMMVDFCVWVLETDGLHAPPFDQHPAGDGTLQALGFTAEGWRAWIEKVVTLQATTREARKLAPAAHNPPMVWAGSPEIGSYLTGLWTRYGPISNDRRWDTAALQPSQHARGNEKIWTDLKPYHKRIPALNIYLVHYDWGAEYLVPPASAILAIQDPLSDPAPFHDSALRDAEGLARRLSSS